jgi:hypothetical protein
MPFARKMRIRSLRRRSNIDARSIQTERDGSRMWPHGSHRTEPAHWRQPWGQFLPRTPYRTLRTANPHFAGLVRPVGVDRNFPGYPDRERWKRSIRINAFVPWPRASVSFEASESPEFTDFHFCCLPDRGRRRAQRCRLRSIGPAGNRQEDPPGEEKFPGQTIAIIRRPQAFTAVTGES